MAFGTAIAAKGTATPLLRREKEDLSRPRGLSGLGETEMLDEEAKKLRLALRKTSFDYTAPKKINILDLSK